ncbi:hypothetical protein Hanom_Chr01g00059431 [Helianthus anomalus]
MGYVKKNYINILRLGYKKPTAFALRASILDLIAFVRLSLFKTKSTMHTKIACFANVRFF